MKMKKVYVCLILIFTFALNLYSEENSFSFVYNLPDFQLAENSYEQNLLDLRTTKFAFFPSFNLGGDSTIDGSFNNGFLDTENSISLMFFQELPCPVSIYGSLSSSILYYDLTENFSWNLVPTLGIQIPLSLSGIFYKDYGISLINHYEKEKKSVDLKYKMKIRQSYSNFISYAGNYLYSKKLDEIYEEKQKLLEQQAEDYSKLYLMGKIQMLQVSMQSSEKLKFYKNQMENKNSIINLKKQLSGIGVEENQLCMSFSDFLDFWEKFYFQFLDDSYYKEEYDINQLELEYVQNIIQNKAALPDLSCSFSVSPDYGGYNSFPDFDESIWSMSIGFSVPVGFNLNGLTQKQKLTLQKNQLNIEKFKLLQQKAHSEMEKKSKSEMYVTYCNSTKQNADLEKERYKVYVDLWKGGKASEFDVKLQKNAMDLAELSYQCARLEYLIAMLSSY